MQATSSNVTPLLAPTSAHGTRKGVLPQPDRIGCFAVPRLHRSRDDQVAAVDLGAGLDPELSQRGAIDIAKDINAAEYAPAFAYSPCSADTTLPAAPR